ncbi:MAG: hypothetical protein AB1602_07590 [Elusimicrobiota bacterium]
MKCPDCGFDNKPNLKFCKKCGKDLTLPPSWFCDTKWHIKTLSIIYVSLIVFYFIASYFLHKLPPPYNQRIIPKEMTPWLYPKKQIED